MKKRPPPEIIFLSPALGKEAKKEINSLIDSFKKEKPKTIKEAHQYL